MGRSGKWVGFITLMTTLLILFTTTDAFDVEISYLEDAVAKGAVCLDGSPPAYHMDKGFGAGVNNWILYFEGGGWCNNETTCLERRDTRLGSSKQMTKVLSFSGIFSNKQTYNPDFYNWNRIKVRYCDGASYTGDVEDVDPETKVYYRGARIFTAVIEDMLSKGMKNAENAMLAGCSAGGLAAILNCDRFRSLLPSTTKVKCLADAGYFINAKTIAGTSHIQEFYGQVVATHGSAKNLPTSCTSKLTPGLCFFPENVIQQIQTPIFILNAAYDSWQVKNILAPGVVDRHGTWRDCKLDITNCSTAQLQTIQEFRDQFMSAVSRVSNSAARGLFIDACYAHCQTGTQETWLRDDSPVLAKTSIAKAVGDWYLERSGFQETDCAYPCNPTCHNRVFDGNYLPL